MSFIITHGAVGDDADVCHHCDNPPCVRPEHLFSGDGFANMQDAASKGRIYRVNNAGENGGNSKLTYEQVTAIRRSASSVSRRELAKRYGVSKSAIAHILTARVWIEGGSKPLTKVYGLKQLQIKVGKTPSSETPHPS